MYKLENSLTSVPRYPLWRVPWTTIFYAFQHHKKGKNKKITDIMLFKHFDYMTISIRSAHVWGMFLFTYQRDWIIINGKMTSWLLWCKLIRCLGHRIQREASPPLRSSWAFGQLYLANPPSLSGPRQRTTLLSRYCLLLLNNARVGCFSLRPTSFYGCRWMENF